jgi:hypothetical protein
MATFENLSLQCVISINWKVRLGDEKKKKKGV